MRAPTAAWARRWVELESGRAAGSPASASSCRRAVVAADRSCPPMQELGGSEKKRIKESLYPDDFEWSSRGRIALAMPPQRMIFEVWLDVAPLAVENFVAIVCGDRGKGSESGVLMSYRNCAFHRVIKGFVAQGGDFVKNNGSGGESIWGKRFKDDPAGLKVRCLAQTTWGRRTGWPGAARPLLSQPRRVLLGEAGDTRTMFLAALGSAGEIGCARSSGHGQLWEELQYVAVFHHAGRRFTPHRQARVLRQAARGGAGALHRWNRGVGKRPGGEAESRRGTLAGLVVAAATPNQEMSLVNSAGPNSPAPALLSSTRKLRNWPLAAEHVQQREPAHKGAKRLNLAASHRCAGARYSGAVRGGGGRRIWQADTSGADRRLWRVRGL